MSGSQPTASQAESGESETASLWLRRGDQFFVGSLLIATLTALVIFWLRSTSTGPLIKVEHLPARQYHYQLDMNASTWIEWTLLEGIGEKLAKRIIADREERGRFNSVDELRRVPGIGPKTLDRIRPWLTVAAPDVSGPATE